MNEKISGNPSEDSQPLLTNQADAEPADEATQPARPRPKPSWGEITEGESMASLWETIKMALKSR